VSFLTSILNVLVVITSLFMICLVLIQRGKGGGLAGAFGGAGGSSAFGTKAGDVFTRITMITALVWFLMLMILVILSNQGSSAWNVDDSSSAANKKNAAPIGAGKAPADGGLPEIIPPPPTAPVTIPPGGKVALPVVPPVSGSGPSAPLPVSPLPTQAPGATTPSVTPPSSTPAKSAEKPAVPKS
jgi:preprotein translocase subunit SecG